MTVTRTWTAALVVLVLLAIPVIAFPRPVVIRIEGSATIGEQLMPELATGYLRSRGVPPEKIRTSGEGRTVTVEATMPGDW